MPKRLAIPFIKSRLAENGYTLLTEGLIGMGTRLFIKCINGHKFYTTWDDFVNDGELCQECFDEENKRWVSIRFKPDETQQIFDEEHTQTVNTIAEVEYVPDTILQT